MPMLLTRTIHSVSKALALTCLCLAVSACVSFPSEQAKQTPSVEHVDTHAGQVLWPKNLPNAKYFINYFEENHEGNDLQNHLDWIKQFYAGVPLVTMGWLDMSQTLEASIDDPMDRQYVSRQLRDIGIRVANEWAQENHLRNISTTNLAIWGSVLRESAQRNEQREAVTNIESDIDQLISRELSSNDISYERYYQRREYDNF